MTHLGVSMPFLANRSARRQPRGRWRFGRGCEHKIAKDRTCSRRILTEQAVRHAAEGSDR